MSDTTAAPTPHALLLQQFLERFELSQKACAEYLRVQQPVVSMVLKGRREMSKAVLARLSVILLDANPVQTDLVEMAGELLTAKAGCALSDAALRALAAEEGPPALSVEIRLPLADKAPILRALLETLGASSPKEIADIADADFRAYVDQYFQEAP